MRQTIKVFLGQEPRLVGKLYYDRQRGRESASFEYDPDWLAAPDQFAIDPTLPLVAGAQFRSKSPGG